MIFRYRGWIFILFFAQAAFAKTIPVCEGCQFSKIQEAVAHASPGDEILIKKGVYRESEIVIDKRLDIRGEGRPVIDGEMKGTIFKIKADSFSVSGLKIINVGHSYTKDFAAILVSRAQHFVIDDLILEKAFFGVLVEKSKFGVVKNCNISSENKNEAGAGNGVHFWHCSHMRVENNEVHHMRDGIYFEFVKRSKILNNSSHDNIRYGLHFMFSNNDEYFENTFENNGAGVAVMFSKYIRMHDNVFVRNWGSASYGLLLKEIYDAEIHRNEFLDNTIGISIEGSTRINYSHNDFTNNGWAIRITGACYQNKFTQNNFLRNAFDVSYNSKQAGNYFNNNYWSEYTGYDLNKDGIGDVPFRPVKLFSYVVNNTPETIVLLRSLFVDIINFSEKVSPVFTPDGIKDPRPAMKPFEKPN